MPHEVKLRATPKGNGYQATIELPNSVSISSAESYPMIAEAITAAALKLLEMPERIAAIDTLEADEQANRGVLDGRGLLPRA